MPEKLQAAPAGMPAPLRAGLHQSRPLVPRSPRWRPGRSRGEVDGWPPRHCPSRPALHSDCRAPQASGPRAGARGHRMARGRLDVRPAEWQADRPSPRSVRLEGTSGGGRSPRSAATRRPSHGCHDPVAPWRPGASRDGRHGLVECRDGQALRARHCAAPSGHSRPAEHVPVGDSETTNETESH